ncbi:MFS transporter [Jatrophihabitans sp. GAS493]|uniref:MFS transporter n=1 Tax=Jatrophihabitans sp. GAS493 TaxID=1907575 RepID=UPI000BB8ED8C|nr:MFS transporter [Jatrophihabitans sp. GAS493]SOD73230.1 MFS transporter [Jatrophihabitans sp. GAS493]
MATPEAAVSAISVPPSAARTTHSEHSEWLALGVCLIAVFMQMLDVTGVNIALPAIGAGLQAPPKSLQLIPIAYTLTFACSLLTAARIGDRYGRRRMFLVGLAAFALMSVACGCATDVPMLVGFRLGQGVAGALMAAQTVAVIANAFAPLSRPAAFAIYGATAGIASLVGPNVGAALLVLNPGGLGWRLIFFVNVPLALVAVLIGRRCIAESRIMPQPRLDLPGAALSCGGLLLFVGALTVGSTTGWGPVALVALAVAPLLLLLFVIVEVRRENRGGDPLFRVALLLRPSFGWGALLALLVYGIFTGLVFTLSLTLQFGVGLSAAQTGAVSLPLALGAIGFAAVSPRLFRRFGARLLVAGTAGLALALLVMALFVDGLDGWSSAFRLGLPLLLAGAGVGVFIAPLPVTLLRDVAQRDLGSASGALPTIQQIGCALGFAVAAGIYFGRMDASPSTSEVYLHAQQTVLVVLAAAAIVAAAVAARIPRDDTRLSAAMTS